MAAGSFNGHALVIGIDEYQNIGRLPAAVINDASDLASFLCDPVFCGYHKSRVKALLGPAATRQAITKAVLEVSSKAKSDDTVLIFFSGHGARIGTSQSGHSCLLPVDFDPQRPTTSVLDSEEFSRLLTNIPSKRLLVLLDACHAGGAAVIKGLSTEYAIKVGLDQNAYDRLAQGAGRVIIASCLPSEVSWVHSGMRNSVFTHCLLQALRDSEDRRGDRLIRIMDVFHDLSVQVPRLEPRQHPILKAVAQNNFPLALRSNPVKQSANRQQVGVEVSNPDVWPQVEKLAVRLYPHGPLDNAVWTRAGGDVSRLVLGTTAIAAWNDALSKIRRGGGGDSISFESLLRMMKDDFPNNTQLRDLVSSTVEHTKDVRVAPEVSVAMSIGSWRDVRFVEIRSKERERAGLSSTLIISEFPVTERDLPRLLENRPPRRRSIFLTDRTGCAEVLRELRSADQRVRLATYEEWQFAIAAQYRSPRTPQRAPISGGTLSIDHWVRNEWGIGVPPASVGEWLIDDPQPTGETAPAASIRIRGGKVSFDYRQRSVHHKLPVRLVLAA